LGGRGGFGGDRRVGGSDQGGGRGFAGGDRGEPGAAKPDQNPSGEGGRQTRMLERFKTMTPDEQKQFIARLKDRGQDTSAFEKAAPTAQGKAPSAASLLKPKYGSIQSAQTIDALFAPLPPVESRGRAWVFMDHQLKPVNLRLGITDGQYTELLNGELQERMEVVTGVTGLGTTRAQPQGGTGNPLMPGRGPGGFGGPGGPGGRGGR